jgi:hypothetical protein
MTFSLGDTPTLSEYTTTATATPVAGAETCRNTRQSTGAVHDRRVSAAAYAIIYAARFGKNSCLTATSNSPNRGSVSVWSSPKQPWIRHLSPLSFTTATSRWVGSTGAFAPNAKLRPLVVQAGAQAPRRRDKPQPVGHDCQVPLSDAELAHHAVEQARRDPARLAWPVAMRLAWRIDVLQRDCGARRNLMARIDQPTVVKKILAHLGLATEALTRPEDPVWRVRGPPDALFPGVLDDAGLPLEMDGVDAEPGEPFFGGLAADDWAA